MKKMLTILLAVCMIVTLFAACGGGSSAPAAPAAPAADSGSAEATPTDDRTFVIGALSKQNADTFVQNIFDAMEARAAELPEVTLLVQDAEGDINAQINQAEAMITQQVDAIILNPVDVEGNAPIVTMAIDAGIPVILCNTLTNNSELATAYVGSDDVDAGRIQAEFLKGVLADDANVTYMMGPIGVSPQIYRKEGIEKYLFDVTNMTVLAEQTANWKRDEALALAENWLTSFQDLDAIICQNDDMALGVLEAVEAAGRKDQIIVVGIDAITDALTAVKAGRLDATVFQDAAGQGAGSVDAALKAAREGVLKMPDVMIPFVLVTQENVDDFM